MIKVCCGPLLNAINEGEIGFMSTTLDGTNAIAYIRGAAYDRMKVCPYCGAKLDIIVEAKQ